MLGITVGVQSCTPTVAEHDHHLISRNLSFRPKAAGAGLATTASKRDVRSVLCLRARFTDCQIASIKLH
jgi:hypothetical protein